MVLSIRLRKNSPHFGLWSFLPVLGMKEQAHVHLSFFFNLDNEIHANHVWNPDPNRRHAYSFQGWQFRCQSERSPSGPCQFQRVKKGEKGVGTRVNTAGRICQQVLNSKHAGFNGQLCGLGWLYPTVYPSRKSDHEANFV